MSVTKLRKPQVFWFYENDDDEVAAEMEDTHDGWFNVSFGILWRGIDPTDTVKLNALEDELVATSGAKKIVILPDYHKGRCISLNFSDEDRAKVCALKYEQEFYTGPMQGYFGDAHIAKEA
jgi:hypothetical protein